MIFVSHSSISNSLLSSDLLLSIIEKQAFGVEYQPIIALDNQAIFAYEALSRFFDDEQQPIRPDLVFAALHDSPLTLHQVELAQKKLQLINAPSGKRLFINLDQDSYFQGQQGIDADSDNTYVTLFKQFSSELVVELIENSEINDAKMSLQMIKSMGNHQIKTALDDVCNEHSMLSTMVLERVDYIKLDRLVVQNKENSSFLLLVNALVGYAKQAEKAVILEGIETPEDLEFARSLGVTYVQGFLFKDKFIKVRA